jgi:hypothetical protein
MSTISGTAISIKTVVDKPIKLGYREDGTLDVCIYSWQNVFLVEMCVFSRRAQEQFDEEARRIQEIAKTNLVLMISYKSLNNR